VTKSLEGRPPKFLGGNIRESFFSVHIFVEMPVLGNQASPGRASKEKVLAPFIKPDYFTFESLREVALSFCQVFSSNGVVKFCSVVIVYGKHMEFDKVYHKYHVD